LICDDFIVMSLANYSILACRSLPTFFWLARGIVRLELLLAIYERLALLWHHSVVSFNQGSFASLQDFLIFTPDIIAYEIDQILVPPTLSMEVPRI